MSVPHVVLIDNYDSFTWNLYELLCREGARVSVFRNDEIAPEDIDSHKPDLIMISPGPGNPEEDSGISRDVIKRYMGVLPVFGVCMGLQCIVSLLGGSVEFAGEIVHGKTSQIEHTNIGVFEGVSQGVSATRYHSLAARFDSLPDSLEITAKTEKSGVIQGLRHREFTVEGVQFHPESIMTQEGRRMLRNFLSYRGGKWSQGRPHRALAEASSILDTIYADRRLKVAAQEDMPGQSLEEIEKSISLGIAPLAIDFASRLRQDSAHVALIAEIKRASPSKGVIAMDIHAPSQALEYARAGASAISVLTEPKWFKGSLDDLIQARRAVDLLGKDRPAILRKEFIFSRYQIAEARLAGADTVLLIVKMLSDLELRSLYEYSVKLGMEPLVEVANAEEMSRANAINAKVIGVNNRDLHSFKVDTETTSSLVSTAQHGGIIAALSGITGPEQVEVYAKQGVQAILVGEALMRAKNTGEFVKKLIGAESR